MDLVSQSVLVRVLCSMEFIALALIMAARLLEKVLDSLMFLILENFALVKFA